MDKNLQKAISNLKKLLFEGEAPVADPAPEMVSVKGKDGVEYFVDKVEAGGIMNTKNEAGELAPVAAGDYELEDGAIVTVAEGGVIEAIKQPEEVPQEEEMKAPTNAEEFIAAISKFAETPGTPDIAKIAIVLKALVEQTFGWQIREAKQRAEAEAAMKIMQEGFAKANADKFKAIFEAIEAISDEPAAPSVKEVKTSVFTQDKSDAKESVRKAFAALNTK